MKNIIIIMLVIIGGYQGWNKFSYLLTKPEPLHQQPYVTVYGRNSCGFTQKALRDLKKAGIPFEYYLVDDKSVADSLHSRMEKSGLSTRRYNLPVIDVNNNLSIRPKSSVIITKYNGALN